MAKRSVVNPGNSFFRKTFTDELGNPVCQNDCPSYEVVEKKCFDWDYFNFVLSLSFILLTISIIILPDWTIQQVKDLCFLSLCVMIAVGIFCGFASGGKVKKVVVCKKNRGGFCDG